MKHFAERRSPWVGKNVFVRAQPRAGVGAIPKIVHLLPVWERSLEEKSPFAVNIAEAIPQLLARTPARELPKVFALLGRTLEIEDLSKKDAERAAGAFARAALRGTGVPAPAVNVIREQESRLRKFPEIWRRLGSFATDR